MTRNVEYAKAYARQYRWKVFPIHSMVNGKCSCGRADCGNPGKHPRVSSGRNDATSDIDTITSWWDAWPDANIGLATGKDSGVVVVDIDPRHGGEQSWADWIVENGEPPGTVTALTGGGGQHFYFMRPADAEKIKGGANFLQGVDVRADGHYVLLPPSNHASGEQYKWDKSSKPSATPVAVMPASVLALVEAGPPKKNSTPKVSYPSDWSGDLLDDDMPDVVPAGQQDDAMTKKAGQLRRQGYEESELIEALTKFVQERCEMADDDWPEWERSIAAKARFAVENWEPDTSHEDHKEALDFLVPLWASRIESEAPEDEIGLLVRRHFSGASQKIEREAVEVVTGADLAKAKPPEIDWIPALGEKGVFVRNYNHIIGAYSGAGKTEFLTQALAAWWASGHRVVWVTEDPKASWARAIHKLKDAHPGLSFEGLYLVFADGRPIEELALTAYRLKPDGLVIDTIRGVLMIEDENSNSEAAQKINPWKFVSRELGITNWFMHHSTKARGKFGTGFAGAMAYLALMDAAVEIHYFNDDEDDKRRTLRAWKRIPPSRKVYEMDERGILHWSDDIAEVAGSKRSVATLAVDALARLQRDGELEITAKDVCEAVVRYGLADEEPAYNAVRNALDRASGIVKVAGHPGGAVQKKNTYQIGR